jgi:hypothetical protein
MGLLVALLEALDNSSGGFARLSGPSAPAWLPELGPWDLYGYLLTAASLACTLLPLVGWGRADGGPLCILLFFWYLRYAGLRFSACVRHAQRCCRRVVPQPAAYGPIQPAPRSVPLSRHCSAVCAAGDRPWPDRCGTPGMTLVAGAVYTCAQTPSAITRHR